jgi:hypothetical protein
MQAKLIYNSSKSAQIKQLNTESSLISLISKKEFNNLSTQTLASSDNISTAAIEVQDQGNTSVDTIATSQTLESKKAFFYLESSESSEDENDKSIQSFKDSNDNPERALLKKGKISSLLTLTDVEEDENEKSNMPSQSEPKSELSKSFETSEADNEVAHLLDQNLSRKKQDESNSSSSESSDSSSSSSDSSSSEDMVEFEISSDEDAKDEEKMTRVGVKEQDNLVTTPKLETDQHELKSDSKIGYV